MAYDGIADVALLSGPGGSMRVNRTVRLDVPASTVDISSTAEDLYRAVIRLRRAAPVPGGVTSDVEGDLSESGRAIWADHGGDIDVAGVRWAVAADEFLDGLAEEGVEFYDAAVQNDAAVLELGGEIFKKIAHESVRAVCESASIDWNCEESVGANMGAKVKRVLTQCNYPPDTEETAFELVLQQAELFATEAA